MWSQTRAGVNKGEGHGVVDHGGLLQPAYGYRVDYAGRSVVVSGDTRPTEALVTSAAGVDVLVHEVAAAPQALLQQSEAARGEPRPE